MKIYLLPGLGFDHRIFSKFEFQNVDVQYLNWIEPIGNESINHYAQRLAKDIRDKQEKVILIGHSLGGIMSQEIACFKKIDKIILISSIKNSGEMPFHFRIVQPLLIHKLFTKKITLSTVKFWGKNQDYETKEEQTLFKEMVGKQSNQYLQWALKTLSIWKQPTIPSSTSIIQIHGDSDKTFPIKHIKTLDYTLKNAGHFMVYKHAKQLNEIINKELKK
jgi:predicted alpha/beta hydrolase family esterase